MKSELMRFAIGSVVACLVAAGCTQATPAPTVAPVPAKVAEPTKAPAPEPTKPPAAIPTQPPKPQPTAEAASKLTYPEPRKPITLVVPFAAGGSSDITARIVALEMERNLGVPVQVVNRGGAGTQVGVTEVALSRPDGYTLGQSHLPTNIGIYLDPTRQAAFGRKDLQLVANYGTSPQAISVKSDSPYKTAKDLVDAARANPRGVTMSTAGLLVSTHMGALLFQVEAGIEFRYVHFEGGGPATAALLGGHVDSLVSGVAAVLSQEKAGEVRILGILEDQRSSLYPDIPTMSEQGFQVSLATYHGFLLPAGVPREIVDVLSSTVKKSVGAQSVKQRLEEGGVAVSYLDPVGFASLWDEQETHVKRILPLAR